MKADRGGLLSLQLLRGLAASLVVVLHTGERFVARNHAAELPFPQWTGAGFAGVDVFFVLSGFIIYYAHRDDLGTGNVVPYFLKRFVRVYPIYWIVMLAVLLTGLMSPALIDGPIEPLHFLKSFLLVPQQRTPFISVSWTLVHEVRFYATFGLLMLLKPRHALAVGSSFMALSAVMLAIDWLAPDRLPSGGIGGGALFLFHPTSLEFGLGVVAAHVALKVRTAAWLDVLILLTGIAAMGIALAFHPELTPAHLRYHSVVMFALPALCLVLGCVLVERRWAPKIPRSMVSLGDASYSVYLIHKPILAALPPAAFAMATAAGVSTLFAYVAAALCIGGGCALYQLCERPLLRQLRARLLGGPVAARRAALT